MKILVIASPKFDHEMPNAARKLPPESAARRVPNGRRSAVSLTCMLDALQKEREGGKKHPESVELFERVDVRDLKQGFATVAFRLVADASQDGPSNDDRGSNSKPPYRNGREWMEMIDKRCGREAAEYQYRDNNERDQKTSSFLRDALLRFRAECLRIPHDTPF